MHKLSPVLPVSGVTCFRPKIKFCLFPLSNRPTKITETQKILLPQLLKNYFSKIFFFHSYYTWTRWRYLITLLLNFDQQTSTLVKNIAKWIIPFVRYFNHWRKK
jgi:hypothetical protein